MKVLNIFEDVWTCSDEFRNDVREFFGDTCKDLTIAEIGSHKGYTTNVLSSHFKKVYAVDNNIGWTTISKQLNANRTNIEYILLDIYKNTWDVIPKDVDVVFIDACHSYDSCGSDIMNAIVSFPQLKYLIFDDYGVWPEVGRVIDDFMKMGVLKFEKFIGLCDNVPGPSGPVKGVNEGIICKLQSEMKNDVWNKTFIWGPGMYDNAFITFLPSGRMNAFGVGYYFFTSKNHVVAYFGGKFHDIEFNDSFTSFTSTRRNDSFVVKGVLF